ncbi:CPBP family intramembrane metalloprotease [Oceanobacillus piezotolerans]|uniref:CPBP family intramembrane metalloprotease n=1 Tax=Oceanobacillus piezotolerans TaxID=2448030 RepID=A0A498DE10_9BACI|nr:type II CAAX endopeptidase family protein [Oceanobacillus piezotolerans]RLL48316.1 CPBP family intramembrane metalloprotease [Oceanobacillus piezotolerans]
MLTEFLRVEKGKNTHPRYILSLFITIIVFGLIITGAVYFGILNGINNFDDSLVNEADLLITDPLLSLYVDLFITIFIILGCWFSVRFVLKRGFKSLITPYERINWRRIIFGFSVFFILLFIIQVITMIFQFGSYSFNIVDWKSYLLLIIAAIILIPIQTTSEELFFRGLLLQWLAKFTKNPIILAIIVGAIFGSLHFFNPEMSYGWIIALDYLFSGFILTYITAKTNSLELAIGAHAANNIFVCLFITTENNVMGGIPSMFLVETVNPYLVVTIDILLYAIFCFIILRKVDSKK